MRIIRRQKLYDQVGPNSDRVIASCPLPAGGTFNGLNLEVHLIASVFLTALAKAGHYGISGFVIPILDPDSALNLNTMWDNQVPKDVAQGAGALDLDTATADTDPEYEFGLPDLSGIIEAGSDPVEIYSSRRMVTVANGPVATIMSSTEKEWLPTALQTVRVRKNVYTKVPSMVLIGVSSPATSETTVTEWTQPTEKEQVQLRYLKIVLRQALINLVGLVEAGAESPWEEASAYIVKILEDKAFEKTAGAFAQITWEVFAEALWDFSTPGDFSMQGALTSD